MARGPVLILPAWDHPKPSLSQDSLPRCPPLSRGAPRPPILCPSEDRVFLLLRFSFDTLRTEGRPLCFPLGRRLPGPLEVAEEGPAAGSSCSPLPPSGFSPSTVKTHAPTRSWVLSASAASTATPTPPPHSLELKGGWAEGRVGLSRSVLFGVTAAVHCEPARARV